MNRITHFNNHDEATGLPLDSKGNPTTLTTTSTARWLALGAVAGPILFNLAWLVLGVVSPGFTLFGTRIEPYSPISQSISGLGLGLTAPFMNAAFVAGGLLIMIGAIGIFRTFREIGRVTRWGYTILLALAGVGMIMDGIFTLESIMPHTAGFLVGTGTPVLSFLIFGRMLRRIPRWRRFGNWLILGSPVTLGLLVLYFATFDPVASGTGLGISGLIQRVLVLESHALIAALGWLAYRRG